MRSMHADREGHMKDKTREAIASALKERIDRAAAACIKASLDAAEREAFRVRAIELFENTIRPAFREVIEAIPSTVARVKPFEQDLKKPGAAEMAMGLEIEFVDQVSGSVKPRLTFKALPREYRFAVVWHHEGDGAWRNTERKSLLPEQVTPSAVEDEAVDFLAMVAK
jgi:hypothetical protein